MVINGWTPLPWDDELIPLDVDNWLLPVNMAINAINQEAAGAADSGTREIRLKGYQGGPQ